MTALPPISLVLPVHNDAPMLQRSLPYLQDAPIRELIVVLDRCTDASAELIRQFAALNPAITVTQLQVFEECRWTHGIAEVFEIGCAQATCPIIYLTAADILFDQWAFYQARLFRRFDLISFRYYHGALTTHQRYLDALNTLPLIYTCKYGKWSGTFGMRRRVWATLGFRDVRSPDLDFMNRAYAAGFSHCYVKESNHIHLRPGLSRAKQVDQGRVRREMGVPLWRVVAHSLVEFKPHVLEGYLCPR